MKQYIITEEDICTIRDYILGAFYEGENKEKIYDLIKAEFSVIRSHPYNPQADRERVLDVDTIGTLLNIVEKDCSSLTTMERMAYRKAKRVEAELRRGEP